MTKEELWEAIGHVDDDLAEDAGKEPVKAPRKAGFPAFISNPKHLKVLIASVAVLVLVIAGWLLFGGRKAPQVPDFDNSVQAVELPKEQGVTIEYTPVTKDPFYTASFAQLIIVYKGHVYIEASRVFLGNDLMGEHLGYITQSINEWTMKENYVEQGGIVSGDFFAVKGYSPDIMVAMPVPTGEVVFLGAMIIRSIRVPTFWMAFCISPAR